MKRTRTCYIVALLTALSLHHALIQPSHAASFSLNPSADAFVTTGPSGNLSISNYGGAGALSVAAPGLSQGEFQSALQFNLAGAKSSFDNLFGAGQWSLQSVTLQLTAAAANNAIYNTPGAGQFGISWMQNDSWQEGTGTPTAPGSTGITFTSLQGIVGGSDENLGTFGFNGATNGASSFTLGLAPGFTADIIAGNNVSLRLLAADSAVSAIFNSRNFGTPANRPLLTVVAVPEPGSVALGATVFAILMGRKVAARTRFGHGRARRPR
jgi:hypothetical protein